MEAVKTPERIPSEAELTELVYNFMESVSGLMDIRGIYIGSGSDDSVATKNHKEVVLEDGTIIALFIGNSLTNKGAVNARTVVLCPNGKHLNIEGLEDAQFYEFGIANHKGEMRSTSTGKSLDGYQFLVKNRAGKSLGDFFEGSVLPILKYP